MCGHTKNTYEYILFGISIISINTTSKYPHFKIRNNVYYQCMRTVLTGIT